MTKFVAVIGVLKVRTIAHLRKTMEPAPGESAGAGNANWRGPRGSLPVCWTVTLPALRSLTLMCINGFEDQKR